MGHAPWHFILKYKGPWACLQRQGTFIRERQKCGTFRASVTLVVRQYISYIISCHGGMCILTYTYMICYTYHLYDVYVSR